MASPDNTGVASGTHLDEEECLPFPIFMAELELLVGNSKRGKPDGVQLLELLQKLVATIPRTDKAVLKQHQRQCETMLYDVLAHGIGAAVRRLICTCFTSLYAHGDPISIYTRVNTLQTYLAGKEGLSRSTPESIRVGLLDFLAHLSLQYGRMLANAAPESLSIASRTASKAGNQAPVRCAALRLAACVVRGLNPADRSAAAVHAEGWAVVQRHAKDRTCEEVRCGCLALLGALCCAGGSPLWREGAYAAEEALRLCLVLSEDPAEAVRDAAFRAMGELAAASRGSAASEAVSGEKRPAKKASAERVVGGMVRVCLVTPLAEAAMHGRREACLAASGAWMSYIGSLPRHRRGQDAAADLLETATLLISAVSEAGRLAAEARTAAPGDGTGELGAGLAGSELPPLQACALFVVRRGVLSRLAEAAQRKLLERLANMLDKRLATPAAVVTLEALATLLEAVGEVTDETGDALEVLLQPYVTSASAATRQQAAATLAALAAAHPAAASRMLSGCLDTVASCAVQMAAPLSAAAAPVAASAAAAAAAVQSDTAPSTPRGDASRPASNFAADGGAAAAAAAAGLTMSQSFSSPTRPAIPNGGGLTAGGGNAGRPAPGPRALMDACHGAALAAARLLLTTARAPLGCPARLQRRALALAEDLVTGPGPELAGNRAICREVGYLLLGSLCPLGVPQATRGSEDMAALWAVALGEAARRDLDERSLFRPGGELDLAVQLWWRAVALQALAAYVAAVQAGLGPGRGSGHLTTAASGASVAPWCRSASVLTPAGSFVPTGSFSVPSTSAAGIAAGLDRLDQQSSSPTSAGVSGLPVDGPDSSGLSRLPSTSGGSAPTMAGSGAAGEAGGRGRSGGGGGPGELPHPALHPPPPSPDQALAALGPLLQPLLELMDTQSYLLDPGRAKGGPGGILAGAAAMFTLCLLEVHLRVPSGRIAPSPAHTALLAKTCLRPFRQHGLSPAAADALTVTALRPLLCPGDSPLGPWPPGRDPLEDALHTYTGGRGAPHVPPWLSPEDHAALLTGGAAPADDTRTATPADELLSSGLGYGSGNLASASAGRKTAAGSALGDSGGGGGISSGSGTSSDWALEAVHGSGAFPQPVGLEPALLGAQLVLLGRLMAGSPVAQQLQMLDVILNALQAAKNVARQNRDSVACRRPPLAVAAAVAALAAYGNPAMAARRLKAPLDPTDKVPEKLLQLAQALLPDESSASAASLFVPALTVVPLSRAAAELYAASAATGSDTWALRVVRALATELAANSSGAAAAAAATLSPHQHQQRAVLAVALGASHRCRSGLAMQGAVASSADALIAVASRPGGAAAAAWALHGLWLVASCGGGAFVSRVRVSLQLAQELLVSSYESAALRAACARLANASVAVLGPEFSLGSWAYERAKSLVVASGSGGSGGGGSDGEALGLGAVAGSGAATSGAHARRASGGGGGGAPNVTGGETGADGGLGLVLFVQQIILFASHAVPPAKHVPLLLSRLLSQQPDLRAASALTLRHLAERSAKALRPGEAAPLLFAALDGEGDSRIAGQLRATLTTILTASAPRAPSFWLDLLSDVVFAAGQPHAAAAAAADGHHHSGGGAGGREDDDDDKYGAAGGGAAAAAAGNGAAASSATGEAAAGGVRPAVVMRSVREVLAAPHLRTRHFAADSLLRMVRVCIASDEGHRDAAALECLGPGGAGSSGRAGGGRGSAGGAHGDMLIAKLQVLVDVGFKLATCPLESLRPHGVRLLTLLVQLFGDVPDPLLPGARLMEQYQAQVVSALRSSLGARQAAAGGLPGFTASTASSIMSAGSGGLGAVTMNGTSGSRSGSQQLPNGVGPAAAAGVGGAAAAAAMVQHPLLQIAGGTLATVFLESGLAAGDAVVLRRLMELLSAPLAAWTTLRYEPYAEWVGVRARVELLRAHAQCARIAAAAAARGDTLCAGIVAKAQEPHAALLRLMWATMLQDHAVLCSQSDVVLEAYASPLLEGGEAGGGEAVAASAITISDAGNGERSGGGDGAGDGKVEGAPGGRAERTAAGFGLTPALAGVLRPVYGAACPAVLAALAAALPPAPELAADTAARTRFRRLLEVGLMLLTDAAARLAHAVHDAVVHGPAARGRTAGGEQAAAGSLPSAPKTAAAPAGFPQMCSAASRLASILPALQRLLAGPYVSLVIIPPLASTSAADAASNSLVCNPSEEPLVPPAVLRDVLTALGATAAHALLPLHAAVLGGQLPGSLASLLPGLALPCCGLVRELCGAAPEGSLGLESTGAVAVGPGTPKVAASSTGADGSGDGEAPGRPVAAKGGSASPALSSSTTSSEIPTWGTDRDHPSCSGGYGNSQLSYTINASPEEPGLCTSSVTAEAVESILLLASVCVPYAYSYATQRGRQQSPQQPGSPVRSGSAAAAPVGDRGSNCPLAVSLPLWLLPPLMGGGRRSKRRSGSADGGGGGRGAAEASERRPGWQTPPGCLPLPAAASSELTAGLAPCAVQVLAAAQQLLRRAPWPALEPHVGPLLELPLRLLLTAPPGEPAVAAAQRYLDTAAAALLVRTSGPAGAQQQQPQQPAPAGIGSGSSSADMSSPTSPVAYAAAALVALADAAELHVQVLRRGPQRVSDSDRSSPGTDATVPSPPSSPPSSSSDPSSDNAALMSGRFAALLPSLLACAAAMDAHDLANPQPHTAGGTPHPAPGPSSPGASSSRSPGSSGTVTASHGAGGVRTAHFAAGAMASASAPHRSYRSRSSGSGSHAHSHAHSTGASLGGGRQSLTAATAAAAVQVPASAVLLLSPAAARTCALGVLASALQEGVPVPVAVAVLEAARGLVQEAAGEDAASARGHWARVLVRTLVPAALERVGGLLAASRQPLAGPEQSLVAECLKLLVLAATLAGPSGMAAQEGVMQILVPLLMELAAPTAGSAAAPPPLRDMALKLITSLPAAAAGAAFKSQLAAQPPAAKMRLQSALRDAATAAAAAAASASASVASAAGPGAVGAGAGAGAGGGAVSPGGGAVAAGVAGAGRRPAIQLKTTFVLPLPSR